MEVMICNDVIRNVDVVRGKGDGLSLKIDLQKFEEPLIIENISTDTIKNFLEFFGKKSLSDIKNFPVRVAGELETDDSETEEEINAFTDIAIGDYLEDKWFYLGSGFLGSEYISCFENIFPGPDIELVIDI